MELPDAFPDQGPMNGIVSGFRATDAEELLLTAVDLPYGDPALAKRLSALRGEADACVLCSGPKKIEPLFAVYGRSCLAAADDCMRDGRKALKALLERVEVRYVTPEELPDFDLTRILTNVNTPEDFRQLK